MSTNILDDGNAAVDNGILMALLSKLSWNVIRLRKM